MKYRETLASQAKLLRTLSYQATLDRGFAIVKTADGHVLKSPAAAKPGDALTISLAKGTVAAEVTGKAPSPSASSEESVKRAPKPKAAPKPKIPPQGSLF